MTKLFRAFDHWLLLRAPFVRDSGVHYVSFYLIAFILTGKIYTSLFVRLNNLYVIDYVSPFLIILSCLGVVFWIYSRISVIGRFYPTEWFSGWYLGWIDLICLALMLSAPVVAESLQRLAVRQLVTVSVHDADRSKICMWVAVRLYENLTDPRISRHVVNWPLLPSGVFEFERHTDWDYDARIASGNPFEYDGGMTRLPLMAYSNLTVEERLAAVFAIAKTTLGSAEQYRYSYSGDETIGQTQWNEHFELGPHIQGLFRSAVRKIFLPHMSPTNIPITKEEYNEIALQIQQIAEKYGSRHPVHFGEYSFGYFYRSYSTSRSQYDFNIITNMKYVESSYTNLVQNSLWSDSQITIWWVSVPIVAILLIRLIALCRMSGLGVGLCIASFIIVVGPLTTSLFFENDSRVFNLFYLIIYAVITIIAFCLSLGRRRQSILNRSLLFIVFMAFPFLGYAFCIAINWGGYERITTFGLVWSIVVATCFPLLQIAFNFLRILPSR